MVWKILKLPQVIRLHIDLNLSLRNGLVKLQFSARMHVLEFL